MIYKWSYSSLPAVKQKYSIDAVRGSFTYKWYQIQLIFCRNTKRKCEQQASKPSLILVANQLWHRILDVMVVVFWTIIAWKDENESLKNLLFFLRNFSTVSHCKAYHSWILLFYLHPPLSLSLPSLPISTHA